MNKRRGTGSIYRRGSIYWIRYSHRGQEFRESSESESEVVARRLLNARIKETGKRGGKFLGQAEERVTFDDLAAMLRTDYIINERRSLRRVEVGLKHLRAAFGLDRAIDVTTDRIKAYIVQRRAQNAANASINRELAALRRMFKLAVQAERLSRGPHISMLEENNVRQGFVDPAEFAALIEALPEYLKDPIRFLYLSAWRRGEMATLEWSNVDMAGQVVRLAPANSKTKDSRLLPLTGELSEIFMRAAAKRRLLNCPLVFHHEGRPMGDFRHSWEKACAAAGLGPLLVHDLRRSSVRNLTRARVPERIAMGISGHKTRSIFDRYNIVSESDLTDALQRRDAYLDARPKERKIIPITRSS